jgi:hypothetical protein
MHKLFCNWWVNISEYVFVEIYYNALTGKKSYALINKGVRIFGCVNYKFWHLHPVDNPSEHIPCDEPTMQDVFSKVTVGRYSLWQMIIYFCYPHKSEDHSNVWIGFIQAADEVLSRANN